MFKSIFAEHYRFFWAFANHTYPRSYEKFLWNEYQKAFDLHRKLYPNED